jgi:exodeoxyribonuclease VII small subunit
MTKPVEELTYRQAMKELQNIVNRLRGTETEDGIDVDELAADVARAKTLLDYCGGKIQQADTQIRSVIRDLKPDDKAEMTEVASVSEPELLEPSSPNSIPF